MKQYGQKITVIGRKAKYCEWEEFIFRAEGSPYRSTDVSFCVGGIFLNKIHHYAANAQWSGLYKRAAKIILVEKLELLECGWQQIDYWISYNFFWKWSHCTLTLIINEMFFKLLKTIWKF